MAAKLQGQTMRVPDWRPYFANWYTAVNPLYPKLIPVVEATLERIVDNEVVLEKLKQSDFALFASSWFPKADWDLLQTIAVYCLWMFLFDDTIDTEITPGVENYASNYGLASEYRGITLDYVRFHMGLTEPGSQEPKPPNVVCALFSEVAPKLRKLLDKDQVKTLYRSLEFFIKANAVEQENRLSNKFPKVADFYTWRLGTTAVDTMCDIGHALIRGNIPPELLREENIIMRYETNKNTIYVNDILSLKKELKDDTLMNLVVLTMEETGSSLDSVINRLSGELIKNGQNFDKAAQALRKKAEEYPPSVQGDVQRLIEAYQLIMTSVYTWTCMSPRYGMAVYRQKDGAFLIPL